MTNRVNGKVKENNDTVLGLLQTILLGMLETGNRIKIPKEEYKTRVSKDMIKTYAEKYFINQWED